MTKQLSIAMAVVFAVACKTEVPSQANAAPSPERTAPVGGDSAFKARSAKIEVKPLAPALPTAPPTLSNDKPSDNAPPRDTPADREEWRKRRLARIDTNGDGVISDEERAAAIRERVANVHARLDTDGDGKLTPAELANARGRMHFDDPAAIDTNHDGDISADELAAALKARREQRRAGRGSAGQDTP